MKATSIITAFLLAAAPLMAEPAVTLEAKPQRAKFLPTETSCVLQIDVVGKTETTKRTAPINLSVVLDRSGSMSGEKLHQAKEAAIVAFDQLSGSDMFSLVIYDQDVEVLIPPVRVRNAEDIHSAIRSIQSRGSTALYDGVRTGAEQLERYFAEENINRVLLLSDGIANIGPSSPKELAQLGSRLARSGISVSTIGLGLGYNEDLMTALAESAAGNYYYVRDPEELPEVFARELGEIKTLVARGVQLIIDLPDSIRRARLLGEEYEFENGRLVIELDDFFGGRTRRFLIECDLPETAAAQLELGRAELVYQDAATGKTAQTTAHPVIRKSDDEEAVRKSEDLAVTANLAIVDNRLSKEKAVKLAEEGKPDAAAKVLRSQRERNALLPEPVATKAKIAREQDTLEETARELEQTQELGVASGKRLKYENYQDKYQKR